MTRRLQIRRLSPLATLPRYMSAAAAGMDLSAVLLDPLELEPGGRVTIRTGLAIAIPYGFEGQIRPRSGLAHRHGLTVTNSPGTIDADYRGEVKVLLVNLGSESVNIIPGQRIAQLVVAPIARIEIAEVDELPSTARGTSGIGSTDEQPFVVENNP